MRTRAFDLLCDLAARITQLRGRGAITSAALSGVNQRVQDLEALCVEGLEPTVDDLSKIVDDLKNRVQGLERNDRDRANRARSKNLKVTKDPEDLADETVARVIELRGEKE